jgi:hypothetical protein
MHNGACVRRILYPNRRGTYIVSVMTVVDASPVVTVAVAVTGATLVVLEMVVVDGSVVVKRHVGRGIGYFWEQND